MYNTDDKEKAWRAANRERLLSYNTKYRSDHPEVNRKWRANNPDKMIASRKRYYQKHKHVIKYARAHDITFAEARKLLGIPSVKVTLNKNFRKAKIL